MGRWALVGILAVLVAACSTGTTDDTQTSTAAAIGTPLQAGNRTAAMYEVRDNLNRGYPPPAGQRWVGVDAQICVTETGGLDIRRWRIRDTTDHTYLPSLVFDQDVPDPPYRDLTVLKAGQCLRGWIPYQLPTAETVDAIVYFAPDGTQLAWKP